MFQVSWGKSASKKKSGQAILYSRECKYCSTYNAIFARGSPGYYFKMLQAGHLALKIRHEGLKIEAPGTQNGSTGPPTSHP